MAAHSVHATCRGVNGSVLEWVVLVVGVWFAAAVPVAVVVGRVLRMRERQLPRPPDPPVTGIPLPRRAPDDVPSPVEPRTGRDREQPGA